MTSNEQPAVLRIGHVTEYDPKTHRARVYFPELDILSHWLSLIVPNSLENHDELHLDTNEHVACLMLGNGIEAGFILGAFYDAKNLPVEGNAEVRAVNFKDGTRIIYDRENHKLQVDCEGDIEITAKGNITLTSAKNITIKASGNITEQAARIDLN